MWNVAAWLISFRPYIMGDDVAHPPTLEAINRAPRNDNNQRGHL